MTMTDMVLFAVIFIAIFAFLILGRIYVPKEWQIQYTIAHFMVCLTMIAYFYYRPRSKQ